MEKGQRELTSNSPVDLCVCEGVLVVRRSEPVGAYGGICREANERITGMMEAVCGWGKGRSQVEACRHG